MRLAAFFIFLAPGAALAADPHPMSVTFAQSPCSDVVRLIDEPAPSMEGAGRMAMAFGYLLGAEAAWGLAGDGTVLQRFRAACEGEPARSGLETLQGLR